MTDPRWPDDNVILYDGACVFCSRWVNFIFARDPSATFRFTPIQSAYGRKLAAAFHIDPANPDTNAVVHDGRAFFKSDAALTVLGQLPHWRWTRILKAVPKPLRDAVYDVIARNRYRIFGTYETCYTGDGELQRRVLE
jgi:predicted DCC family thiol-disulfide oxidoreductase YuxK